MCEGIWNAPYADGDLDRTDLVFGSGVRVRGDTVVFVSSGTTVDRLHTWAADGGHCVSNSLPCLLAFVRGSLDLSFERYDAVSASIKNGLRAYVRDLRTTAGPVRLTYFNNLVWDFQDLCEVEKPLLQRDFSSYESYRAFSTRPWRGWPPTLGHPNVAHRSNSWGRSHQATTRRPRPSSPARSAVGVRWASTARAVAATTVARRSRRSSGSRTRR